MIRRKFLAVLFFTFISTISFAADPPDTVLTGIYITSIHDIDFRQKEYAINFWVWFNYQNPDFDFAKYGSSSERKRLLAKWDSEVKNLPK